MNRDNDDCMLTRRPKQTGFSLVELMVALVIGLILLGGLFQIYRSNTQTNRMTESLSRLQENARFSVDLLSREIRMAGFMPCRDTGKTTNVLNTISGGPASAFRGEAIEGVDGSGTNLPSFGTAAGDRVSGTDAFWIQGGGDRTFQVNKHQPSGSSASFFLKGIHDLQPGDIVMVCDTVQSSVFQITNSNTSNQTIVHNTGSVVTPGNCVKQLGYSVNPCTTPIPYTYGSDAMIVQFRSIGYFIGVGSDGATPALYRRELQRSGTSVGYVTQQLVDGVENMQVQYGIDTDDDRVVERYVDVGSVSDWSQVVAVRLGLLVRSADEVASKQDDRTYYLAGTPIGTTTADSHPKDKRLRLAFNMTIKIRNRGL